MKKIFVFFLALCLTKFAFAEEIMGIKRVPIKSCSPKCQIYADFISQDRYHVAVYRELIKKWEKFLQDNPDGNQHASVKSVKKVIQAHNAFINRRLDFIKQNRRSLEACEKKFCQSTEGNVQSALRQFGITEAPAEICESCKDLKKQQEKNRKREKQLEKDIFETRVKYELTFIKNNPDINLGRKLQEMEKEYENIDVKGFFIDRELENCDKKCGTRDSRQSYLFPSNGADNAYVYLGGGFGVNRSKTTVTEMTDQHGHPNSNENNNASQINKTHLQTVYLGVNKEMDKGSVGAELFLQSNPLAYKTTQMGQQNIIKMGIKQSFGFSLVPAVKLFKHVSALAKIGLAKGQFQVVNVNNDETNTQTANRSGTLLAGGAQVDFSDNVKFRLTYNHTSYGAVERGSLVANNSVERFKPKTKQLEAAVIVRIS